MNGTGSSNNRYMLESTISKINILSGNGLSTDALGSILRAHKFLSNILLKVQSQEKHVHISERKKEKTTGPFTYRT